jgi:diazepam-binding inhibitor (GABA receptor modulating acyl-CoA-binding protein)
MTRFENYVKLVDGFKRDGENADTISSDTKLKLYGLYKQSTIGDVNTSRPSMIYFVECSKWDAWDKNAGLSKECARSMYVNIVKEITRRK